MKTIPFAKHEWLRSALLILLLLAIAVAALELPRQYYENADTKFAKKIIDSEYEINLEEESLSISDKFKALVSNDSIITVETQNFSNDVALQYQKAMESEFEKMLDYGWKERLCTIMRDDKTSSKGGSMKILRVIDNKIYSFELGILLVKNARYGMNYGPAIILFDMETNKILYMSLYSDLKVNDMHYLEYSSYYQEENYLTDEIQLEVVRDDSTSILKALEHYYGQSIDASTSSSYITNLDLQLSPYTIDELGTKTFTYIYTYIYETYSEMFEYRYDEEAEAVSY